VKPISLSLTAVNWKNSFIEGHFTTARTCVHLLRLERAHAQLHLSRVDLKHLPLKETFWLSEKNWKFVMIIDVLRNVRPTRYSVLTNKRFRVPKVKFKANVEHKNYDQKPRWRVCHVLLGVLTFRC